MNSVLTIPLSPSSCIILNISFTTLSTSSSTGGVGSLPSSLLTETMMTPRQQLLSQALCSFELLKKLKKFKQNIERIMMEIRHQKRVIKRLKRDAQSDMRRNKLIAYVVQSLKRDHPQYHSQPSSGLPLQVHDVRWEIPSSLVVPLQYMMYSFCMMVVLILIDWASGLGRCCVRAFHHMLIGFSTFSVSISFLNIYYYI